MQYAFHFVPKTSSLKKKEEKTTYVKQSASVPMSQYQKEAQGQCWNQPEIPPWQASDCLQKILNPKKEERERNEHFKISTETHKLYFPRDSLQNHPPPSALGLDLPPKPTLILSTLFAISILPSQACSQTEKNTQKPLGLSSHRPENRHSPISSGGFISHQYHPLSPMAQDCTLLLVLKTCPARLWLPF